MNDLVGFGSDSSPSQSISVGILSMNPSILLDLILLLQSAQLHESKTRTRRQAGSTQRKFENGNGHDGRLDGEYARSELHLLLII